MLQIYNYKIINILERLMKRKALTIRYYFWQKYYNYWINVFSIVFQNYKIRTE